MKCPCNPKNDYANCCEPYHQGQAAPSAELLMRSRYSAYVLNKANYLFKSWSQTTRPTKKSLKQDQPTQWLGLEIIRSEHGTVLDSEGIVEFKASYMADTGVQQLHETSRFIRENSRWVYLDGEY